MCSNVDVFDLSIWHPQTVFIIEVLLAPQRAVKLLLYESAIVRMHALQEQIGRRSNGFIESHDPIGLFRPEALVSTDLPTEASGVTEPLRFRQIGLAPPQLCDGRPQIVACAAEGLRRAFLRHADPNHEQGGDGKKRDSQSALNSRGERMHRGNEKVIESQYGESGCKQTRAEAAKPGREKDRAEKQRHKRRALQEAIDQ
jgi:hypothetical protein